MTQSISVAELFVRGVELRPFEAVAIARALIHADPAVDPRTPAGPPTLSSVHVSQDGTVTCCSCSIRPNVSEVALLLNDILRKSGAKPTGALRYAVARALHQVDAPPFESIADFSRALERFEQDTHADVVRDVWTRAVRAGHPAKAPRFRHRDRRRNMPAATALRLELREADLQLYELSKAVRPPMQQSMPARPARRRFDPRVLATLALVVAAVLTALLIARPAAPVPDALPATAGLPPSASSSGVPAATPRSEPAERSESSPPEPPRARIPRTPEAAPAVETPALVRAAGDRGMFSPSFAPDGTAMFFHTGLAADPRSALMSVRSPGGANDPADDLGVVMILEDGARNYHVRPSPDGTRIAFDSDRDGERGVYVAASDGTDVRRVSGAGYAAVPTWSPDGGRLAFVRGEPDRPGVWNLWLYTLSTGATARITNYRFGQTWGASWFPDGRRICYSHEDRLLVHDLAAGPSRHYASPVPGRLVRTPAVSPDGQRVIFQVARHGAWLLDLSDDSMRVVLADPTAEEFAWSPDGRRVAFHSKRDGGWGIWVTTGS